MKKINFFALGVMIIPLAFIFIPKLHVDIGERKPLSEKGIRFETKGWNHALTEAKRQHKLVFLDAFASWCGPCKRLKRSTFTDKAVGDFFNDSFINITVDMEKGEGVRLAEKYGINAYPTLLIVDSDGNPVTYTKGYLTPKELLEFGKHGFLSKPGH